MPDENHRWRTHEGEAEHPKRSLGLMGPSPMQNAARHNSIGSAPELKARSADEAGTLEMPIVSGWQMSAANSSSIAGRLGPKPTGASIRTKHPPIPRWRRQGRGTASNQ